VNSPTTRSYISEVGFFAKTNQSTQQSVQSAAPDTSRAVMPTTVNGVIVVGPRGRQRRVVQGDLDGDTQARIVPAHDARRGRSLV
jgi:hypothetical protein